MIICRSYGLVKLNLWPFYHLILKCDLDLQSTWINVSNEQLCQINLKSMHKCRSYGPDKPNLWPFYHLTCKCDLDLQPTWTNVSNGTSIPQGEQLCHILKSMHKCRSYGPDKLNLWPFYHLTWKCDLDLQLSRTNVSNEQLCQIILKSMHKCRSHGPDKLNLRPFYHLTFKWDLGLQPNWTNASNGTPILQGKQMCHIFFLKPMHKCRSYGPAKLRLWLFYHLMLKVWPWPSTFLNKCFIWHFYSSRRMTVPNDFEINA